MRCKNILVCSFFQRKVPIHDAMYKTNVTKYCEGNFQECAIFQALQKTNFLNIPKDLYPNQTFRVKDIK